jgi:lipoprotein-anchoring transpeptidase ErfK/SrfK
MKTVQNFLLSLLVLCFFHGILMDTIVVYAGALDHMKSASHNQKAPLLVVKKQDNIVIYRKDIIVHPDEFKVDLKSSNEEFKPIEKTGIRKQVGEQEPLNLTIVDKYLREGKKIEARNILSDLFINKRIPKKQKEIKELLDKLNKELIFSPLPLPDAVIYTVQPGDVLERIARKFNTTYELIMRINDKTTTRIRVGEKLKILTGKTKILINKSDFTLTLLLNNYYVRQYKICIGKDDKTPEGIFEVKDKLKKPTWYAPQGGVFPYGHEENILGTRWIGFKDRPDASGFGIHGTTQPETIGTAASMGCIRMLNTDVEEVYDFVTSDTEIIIQG